MVIIAEWIEMDLYEFYKELYFHEIERKDKYTNSLAIPIGVLTIFGGIIFSYFKIWSEDLITVQWFSKKLFILFLILSVFFVLCAVFCLTRGIIGYAYSYISPPERLEEYRQVLLRWYESQGNSVEEASMDFKDTITQQYIDCIQINTLNNDSKSVWLYMCFLSLTATFILILFCTIFYSIVLFYK